MRNKSTNPKHNLTFSSDPLPFREPDPSHETTWRCTSIDVLLSPDDPLRGKWPTIVSSEVTTAIAHR